MHEARLVAYLLGAVVDRTEVPTRRGARPTLRRDLLPVLRSPLAAVALVAVAVVQRDASGAATLVRGTAADGTVRTVSGEAFRARLGLLTAADAERAAPGLAARVADEARARSDRLLEASLTTVLAAARAYAAG